MLINIMETSSILKLMTVYLKIFDIRYSLISVIIMTKNVYDLLFFSFSAAKKPKMIHPNLNDRKVSDAGNLHGCAREHECFAFPLLFVNLV